MSFWLQTQLGKDLQYQGTMWWGWTHLDAHVHACMHASSPISRSFMLITSARSLWSWKTAYSQFQGIRVWISLYVCVCSVAQLCLTLCDPMDCSLPGTSVYGLLQANILEWVAISLTNGSSCPRDRTRNSCISSFGRWTSLWGQYSACHKVELGVTSINTFQAK